MGFIGGGAILKRGDIVHGVTTAATLWFVTVMGLCLGGGQIALGVELFALALFVLWGLKWIELRFIEDRRATLSLTLSEKGPGEHEIRRRLGGAKFEVTRCATHRDKTAARRSLEVDVRWRARATEDHLPPLVAELAEQVGVLALTWDPKR
jgi:putative Mg2+ transporter-C (MgtC) family protein